MTRPNPVFLLAVLVGVALLLGGALAAPGGLYLARDEGATLNLMQVVLRMADGERPHLDFISPLGPLAHAPIAWLMRLGLGLGHAVVWAQVAMALLLLPAAWWAGYSRFAGWGGYALGALALGLVLALVPADGAGAPSIAGHAQRWSWAVTVVILALSVLPPRNRAGTLIEAIAVGLGLAGLALLQIAFAAFFAPVVLLSLALHGGGRALVAALGGAAVAVALVTLWAGRWIWAAYVGDLSTAGLAYWNDAAALPALLAPSHLAALGVALAGIAALRGAGRQREALLVALCLPGFAFLDLRGGTSVWLAFVALALLDAGPQPAPAGAGPRRFLVIAATAALALAAPGLGALATSPFRHAAADGAAFAPILPDAGRHADMRFAAAQTRSIEVRQTLARTEDPLGDAWPDCEIASGLIAWVASVASDVEAAGLARDRRLLAADALSPEWMFGPLRPVRGGAPHHAAGLSGIEDADYLLVPICPASIEARTRALAAAEARGLVLTELRRTELYRLYAIGEATR